MIAWLVAFLLTIAIEVPIAVAILDGRRLVVAALLAQAATHPLLWLAVSVYPTTLVPAELAAVIVEAGLYVAIARASPRRAVIASIVANATSCGIGLLLA